MTSAEIDLIARAVEARLAPRSEPIDQRFEALESRVGDLEKAIHNGLSHRLDRIPDAK